MPDFWDKVTLKLGAIESYRYDNPSRAAALADELCDMSKKPGPLPGLEMSDANLSRYWERVLIPQIAYVDTPKVQALLEQAAKDDFSRMQLVGAWSNLDIDKAIKMADQVLKDEPDAAYGPHDQSIDDSYVEFLTNLAKTDPNAAARRLVAFKLVPTIYPESDDGGMLYIVALDIVRALWRQYPDQARDFCAQPMPWRKEFGPKPGDLVDCLEMNEQIRKNPLHSEARLKKFLAKVPDGFGYLLGMGPIETTSAVCQSLARKDPGAAIRISALLGNSYQHVKVLLNTYNDCGDLPFEKRRRLLEAAITVAKTLSESQGRDNAFLEIGREAKRSWQRLQPWPPKEE